MYVRIITEPEDRKWILYRFAEELKNRLPCKVEIGESPDDKADINYYINFAIKIDKGFQDSKCDVGWFTHPEPEKYFLDAVNRFNWCICHAEQYERLLKDRGCSNVSVITPGVDEQFKTELKIGVVGKKYNGIRKGADVVEFVQKMYPEFIKVYFTHPSWGTGEDVPFEKLNDFYQKIDFLLVPSRLEGGPMPVMEALACGKEIIANRNVGNIRLFKDAVYHFDSLEPSNLVVPGSPPRMSLSEIMGRLLAHKLNCRRLVKDYTWQRFADEHYKLFEKLCQTSNSQK